MHTTKVYVGEAEKMKIRNEQFIITMICYEKISLTKINEAELRKGFLF